MNTQKKPTTLKKWMEKNLTRDRLEDIQKHGCSCGIPGLIHNNEICALYKAYTSDIWDTVGAYANETGQTIPEALATLKFTTSNDNDRLVWFAVEYLAQSCDSRVA